MRYLDDFLNGITMYRLVLYGLLLISAVSVILNPIAGFSLLLILATCQVTNWLLVRVFKAMASVESALISGLILFLIMEPTSYMPAILASLLAMGSKYFLAIHKKHIFNPVGIALFILWVFKYGLVVWWIATPTLLPVTAMVGFLVVRKLRRFSLFFAFLISAVITAMFLKISPWEFLLSWPVIFFGTIMLTEPQTTPPSQRLQIVYGILMGVLFSWQFTWAFVVGNIFSYLVSPKQRSNLKFKSKQQLAPNIVELTYASDNRLKFEPGQYLEWTLPHPKTDARGNRRYFTIASSPTETEVRLGVRTFERSSSFKKALLEAKTISASQLAGDFVMPKDQTKKLVWIAGGIGITPYRSMAKYLSDTRQHRNVILLYMCSDPRDFVYKEIFTEAGVQSHYLSGHLDSGIIKNKVPDYRERLFYLSGPRSMVDAYVKVLKLMGVSSTNIKTDFFPGLV